MFTPPPIPLVLLSSVTLIDSTTTTEQARRWQIELESLYNSHYRDPEPVWTWDDVQDLDRDALIELEEVIRAGKTPPLDLDLVSSFRTPDWRKPYWKHLFAPYTGEGEWSTAQPDAIPLDEQIKWQRTMAIQSCDGDLSGPDRRRMFADWQKAQEVFAMAA